MALYTNNKGLTEPTVGSSGWDTPLNTNFGLLDIALGSAYSIDAGTGGTIALPTPSIVSTPPTLPALTTTYWWVAQQWAISSASNLISNVVITIPSGIGGAWIVSNGLTTVQQTTYTVTIKVTGQTGITIPAASKGYIFSNGTDVYYVVNTASINGNVAISGNLSVSGTTVPRVNSITSSATPAPNADTTDQFEISAQAATITSFGAPTGTPVDGQKLIIRIYSAAAQTITAWNSIYATIGTTLPTTTVAGKYIYVGCIYNSTSSKWDVVAVGTQA
jgi:hypothetical protein